MQNTTQTTQTDQDKPTKKFNCPNCGPLTQEDVIFLCNTCKQEELIVKDNMYICPACLAPGENFECFKCGSKEVKLAAKD